MKKVIALCLILVVSSCAELQQVVNNLPQQGYGLTQEQIGQGLKQALDKGIDQQVTKLTQQDGI